MKEPTLVILAAGMGSRFGGLKQITPVDDNGHMIIDFSMYDAKKAGFKKLVFIIKESIAESFKETVGRRMEEFFEVKYVYQELDKLPEGFSAPDTRTKPWGTAHAILCAKDAIDGPFAVINSDDYYGASAFKDIYDFLKSDDNDNNHAMVGYLLKNTVTENGHVARGVCEVENGLLKEITERTKIIKRGDDAAYTEDGENFVDISGNTMVSMNFWGFKYSIFDKLQERFKAFLSENLDTKPDTCEFFLPLVADAHIKQGDGDILVIPTKETWYGVTYREDLPSVVSAIKELKTKGMYPDKLWER